MKQYMRGWIRNLMQSLVCRPRRGKVSRNGKPRRVRLLIEGLEERVVPSIWLVTNTSNSAATSGSLPWAVAQADADTSNANINFNPTDFASATTITLAATLTLSNTAHSITINGTGAGPITVSGGSAVQDFSINSGVTAVIENLTVANGSTSLNGAGINNSGTLTVASCTISGNTVTSSALGGGIYNNGTTTVSNCTINGNSAQEGAGIYNNNNLTVTASTLSTNTAGGSSGTGGGIEESSSSTATLIENCTLYDNSAGYTGAGIEAIHPITIVSCTIADNTAGSFGGGIDNYYGDTTVTIGDTILAFNSAASAGPNFQNQAASLGGNMISNTSTGGSGVTGWIASDLQNVTPNLGPLQNNGGPTSTMALLAGPGIGAGLVSIATTYELTTDQRGLARIVNNLIDIGAYENQSGSPTVASVNPNSGGTGGGTSVIITGTGFTGAAAVDFGSTAATSFTVNSATQITATAPAGSAGTVNVTVTTPGGTSATSSSDDFTYLAAPTVTGVSPSSGPSAGGATVTITGTSLLAATAVDFGSNAATTYTVNSNTQITATAPAGLLGTVNVTVTTSYGTSATSSSDDFTYVAAPTVSGVSPTSGPASGGTTVTITGTNLTAATAVDFGSNAATTYTVNSNTQITATAPAGSAGTVNVTVITAGGTSTTSSSDDFTYLAAPTVTGVSPSSGPVSGDTTVTITGANLTGATAVDFGNNAATTYTVNSNTQITATAPTGSAGTVNVTVTAAGGTSATSSSDDFTYLAAPTVTVVSPSSGPASGGTTVTITGTSLLAATAVDFGSNAATTYTVNSNTQITATAPAGSVGTVNVTVTTSYGASATTANDDFTYLPGLVVTNTSNSAATSGSLPWAVAQANAATSNSLIAFDSADFPTPTTISLTGTLTLSNTAHSTTVEGLSQITVSCNGSSVFQVNAGVTAAFTTLQMTGSSSSVLFVDDGALSLTNCIVSGDGDGVQVASGGTLTATDSTLENSNTSENSGGVFNNGQALLTNCTLMNDSGAFFNNGGTATLEGCTLSGNRGGEGVIYSDGGSVTISNCTLTGNSVSSVAGAIYNSATMTICDSTIDGNTSTGNTGGIYNNGTMALFNTIVAGNSAAGAASDIGGSNVTGSFNFIGAGAPGLVNGTNGNHVGTSSSPLNPLLGALGNNGGPTETMSEQSVSPAIGAGGAVTTLGAALTSTTSTSITVSNYHVFAAQALPALSSGSYFIIEIGAEQMAVTGLAPASGTTATLTVVRGVNGTTAATYSSGASIYLVSDQRGFVVPANNPALVDIGAYESTGVTFQPWVLSISPTSGSTAGGTSVTISGFGFTNATAVLFGSSPATGFTVNSANQITAIAPAGTGTVDVTVAISGGPASATSSADQFTYIGPPTVTSVMPNSGPNAGGTTVTIIGAEFTGATAVQFGTFSATTFTVNSSTQIIATCPAESAGTVNVTVTTSYGTSATSSSDDFTYLTAPSVTGVNPSSGPTGGGTTVTITGTNLTGATAVHFGSTAATSYTVNSNTQITATSPAESAGTVNVTVTTAGGTSATSSSDDFTYGTAPAVTGLNPSYGPTNGGTTVNITGVNLTGATAVDFGSTAATTYTVNSATQITATAPAGSAGTINVTVATSYGTSATSSNDDFTFLTVPTVTGVSPSSGPTNGGTTVTITGTSFLGTTVVDFGTNSATTYTVISNTQITATAPAGSAGTIDVTVTNAEGTSATLSSDHFTYVAAPTVTGVNPSAGPTSGGTTVTITGTNLTGATAVDFGSTAAATYTVNSSTQITATDPAESAGTVNVSITTAGGTSATSSGDDFSYVAAPTVTGVIPSTGPVSGGTIVTITGTSLLGATAVNFGSNAATTYTTNSATQITATAPAGSAGTVNVSVVTPYGTSATSSSDQFTYLTAPTVTGVSPFEGPASGGTTVTITGTSLLGATAVDFGSNAATTYTVISNTQITATAPAGTAGTIDVTVTNAEGTSATSSGDDFTYVAAPSVTGVNPSAGPTSGTTVTITGTNLTGTTAVHFGSNTATTYTVNSSTQITATAPAGSAGTVNVSVTTAGGTSATSSSDDFTYVAAPTVTGVSPSSGPASGGATVTIIGTNLTTATAVDFGSTAATTYTVNSATQITATAPAGSAGTVNVSVTTAGGTSATSSSDDFTYLTTPTVTGVSPNGGLASGGTTVTITGTSLLAATAVDFGSNAATTYTVDSNTQITATAPAGSAGTVNVTVTTAYGTSATSSSDQFTYIVLVVTNTSNSAATAGSLPWCVAQANAATSNADITFDAADFTSATTITLASTLTLGNTAHSITIDGTGAGPITVSGGGAVQDVVVSSGNVSISNLTFANGYSSSYGGAVDITGGSLTIQNCTISDNSADFGGGISNVAGWLLLENCVISGNTTPGDFGSQGGGGGIYEQNGTVSLVGCTINGNNSTDWYYGGGILTTAGSLTIDNCTISDNTGEDGGGIGLLGGSLLILDSTLSGNSAVGAGGAGAGSGGGLLYSSGTATVIGCTISDNEANLSNPNTGGSGGGISDSGTSMTVVNCSIVGNKVYNGDGGGIFSGQGGGEYNDETLMVTNSTIASNSAIGSGDVCGGVYDDGYVSLANSVVAANSASGDPDFFTGTNETIACNNSLIGNTSGSGITGTTGTGNILNPASAGLGTLGSNGGPNQTIPLLSGSPAIGAGGAVTTNNAAIASTTATTLTIAANVFAAASLPSLSSGSYFTIQIGSEQMAVTSANGSTLTVVRGINGTTAATHSAGASVYTVSDQRGYVVPSNAPPVVDMGAYQSTGVNASPTITAVNPDAGNPGGGTTVTITGTNFVGATAVSFGSTRATSFTVNSNSQIIAVDPAETAGTVNITLIAPLGTSAQSASDQFTYLAAPTVTEVSPSSGPTSGGTTVTITGTNLLAATAVDFGSNAATTYTVDSATQITATAPAGSAGTVNVTVTNSLGTSENISSDDFTFLAAPTVTGVNPSSGPTSGGTTVTITGTSLLAATAVDFGSNAATTYSVNSNTQITAIAPAGSLGTIDVTVATAYGTSATSSSDDFTYSDVPIVSGLSPNSGPASGGTTVTITGTSLLAATAVDFGNNAATTFTVNSPTQITAVAPAGTAGTVDVTVTTGYGISAISSGDQFTYGTFLVTNTSNNASTNGSLPWAVAQADSTTSNADIIFDPADFTTATTITLASTLTLSNTAHSITIDGSGAGPITVNGGGAVQDFLINASVTATLNNLTISGGSITGDGAGIDNAGSLTLNNDTISGNDETAAGSSNSSSGGGILNSGSLTLSNCTVSGNTAVLGGGVANRGTLTILNSMISNNNVNGNETYHISAEGGGVYVSAGQLLLENSTITDNANINPSAGYGFGGGLFAVGGATTILSCLFSQNTSIGVNGGSGGAIYATFSTLVTAVNSTFTDNTAYSYDGYPGIGGAICSNGSTSAEPTVNVVNCTLYGNSAGASGGGYDEDGYGTVNLTNDILWHNTATNGNDLCENGGYTTTVKSSLFGSSSAAGSSGNLTANGLGNILDVATSPAILGALGNNGGPTQTLVPAANSLPVGAARNVAATYFQLAPTDTSVLVLGGGTFSAASLPTLTSGFYYSIQIGGEEMAVTAVTDGTSISTEGVINGGSGYQVGDVLTVAAGAGGGTAATLTVSAVNSGGSITAVTLDDPGLFPADPQYSYSYPTEGHGSGAEIYFNYVAASQLSVTRGANGTTTAAHPDSAPVYLVSDQRGELAPFSFTPAPDMGAADSQGVGGSGLAFYVQPVNNTTNSSFTVSVADTSGGTPVAGATITLAISSGSLTGTTTALTNSSGIAVFSNLNVSAGGSYTLSATGSGFQATSNSFTLSATTTPTVVSVSPNSGNISGGATVYITGTNFTGATAVDFGTVAATSFTVNSITQITAVVPANAAGTVDVTVSSPQGTSADSSSDQFTYVATELLVVTNTNATGAGSLVGALETADAATSPAVITFSPSVFNTAQTITLTNSLVFENPTQPITIDGPTAATLTISGDTQSSVQIQDILMNSGTATVQNLTFTQGNAGQNSGGAVSIAGGTLTIDNSTISDSTGSSGGGIFIDGGGLAIANSTITGNTTANYNLGYWYAGGVLDEGGSTTILNCLITQNSVNGINGGTGGGIAILGGDLAVVDSTLTSNTAMSHAQYAGNGGAIYAGGGSLNVTNCTLYGNTAANGTAGGLDDAYPYYATVTLVNDILWHNTAGAGDGNDLYEGGTLTTVNSCLIGDATDTTIPASSLGNILNVAASPAILGTQGNNGGPTQTMVPVANSLPVGAATNVGITNYQVGQADASILVSGAGMFGGATLPILTSGSYYTIQIGGEELAVTGATEGQAVSSFYYISGDFGSGYQVGDVLAVVGGIGTPATFTVDSVGSNGSIASASVSNPGFYTTTPTNPVSVTGGHGSGAKFDLNYSAVALLYVTRGANGTTAAAHPANAPIYLVSDQRGELLPFSFTPTPDMGAADSQGVGGTGLAFYVQPGNTTTNSSFTVSVADIGGGTPVAGATITLAISSGSLTGTTTAVTNSSGIAVFSNLSVSAGVTCTLTASVSGSQATSNAFTISASTAPTVVSVSPNSGNISGGATVYISGTNFTGATAVDFGTVAAISFTVNSLTQIAAIVPAQAAGTVNVSVTGPQGTSAGSSGDQYTYIALETLVVTNTNATGPGSLASAMQTADVATSPVVITFSPSVFNTAQTITLTNSQVFENPNEPITLNGPTAATLTISGDSQASVLIQDAIVNSGTASIENLKFTNGNAGISFGGGIAVGGGTATIDNCTVANCSAAGGGGISVSGGTALVENCTVSGNAAQLQRGYGGGIAGSGSGSITVLNSTIDNNTSNGINGAPGGGLAEDGSGAITVVNSTICGNTALGYAAGGGMFDSSGTITVVNCTITGNSATNYGGGFGTSYFGNLAILSSIIWNNSAPSDPDYGYSSYGGYTNSVNYTLIGNTSGDIPTGVGNIIGVGTSPSILGTLGNNGGPTQAFPLAPGCPAIGTAGSVTTISANVANTTTTTISLANSSLFVASSLPTLSSGSYFTIQIGSEQMAVIGANGSTLTVVRGINGTTAATHASGASVYLVSDQRGYLVPANNPPVVDMGAYQTTGVNGSPSITALNPDVSSTVGGATVTITGTNFTGTTAVSFGSTAATSFTVNSNTQITAVDPAEAAGTVNIILTTPLGISAQSASDHFTYIAPPTVTANTANLPDNATSLTITGTGFDTNTANDTVTFNNGLAGTVTAATATQLTVSIATPPAALGSLTATVTTDGQSNGTAVQVATVLNGDWIVTDPSGAAGSLSDVTLPYAVTHALNGDQITFASGLTGGTISLSSPLTINSNVTITGPATGTVTLEGTLTVGAGATVNEQGNLTIGSSGALIVVGVLNIYGTVEISSEGGYYDEGTVNVEAGGTLSDQDSITVTAGSVLNDFGNVTEGAGGTLTVDSGGTLNTYGTVTIEAGGALIIEPGGTLDIYGTVTIEAGAAYSPLGTVNIEPGGVLNVAAPVVTSSTTGMLVNTPTLTINGYGFDPTAANDSITFNDGAAGTVTSATATSLTVAFSTAPTATGSLTAVVTTDSISSGAAVQVATVSFVNSVVVNADYAPIVDISSDGVSTVTVTTDGNNGFTAGNTVVISGYTGTKAGYDGTFTVQSTSGDQFTVTNTTPGLPVLSGNSAGFAISQNTASDLVGLQRSMVDSVVYTFTSPVSLTASNFTLTTSTPSVSGAPSQAPAPATLVPGMVLTSLSGGSIWVVSWVSGGGTGSAITGHSLADGVYNMTLGNSNEATDTFYRLYGDVAGYNFTLDRACVSNADSLPFTHSYLLSTGAAMYLADVDYDANGVINNTDSLNLTHRYMSLWTGFMPTI